MADLPNECWQADVTHVHLRSGQEVEVLNQQLAACKVNEPWLWAWRGLANYIVPKIDVQVSGILRSQPNVQATNDPGSNGASASANYIVANAAVAAAIFVAVLGVDHLARLHRGGAALDGEGNVLKGLEMQLVARPWDGWTIQAAGSWNHSEQTNSPQLLNSNPDSPNFGKVIQYTCGGTYYTAG